jgi:hypothetical protein
MLRDVELRRKRRQAAALQEKSRRGVIAPSGEVPPRIFTSLVALLVRSRESPRGNGLQSRPMIAVPIAADWSNFLVAEVGASAALAGLIFVAVSINLSKIIEYPGVSGRAGEALALLMGVLIIATLGLAPDQSQNVLGVEFLLVGVTLWIFIVTLHVRQLRRAKQPWWWLASRAALCQLTTLSFCVAGIMLILGHAAGMNWLVPGCVFAFLTSTTSAWVLLIEIIR